MDLSILFAATQKRENESPMKLYHVVTPEYSYTERVCAEGGPTYPVCDVIEVEAKTARDAVALGVVEMLKGGRQGKYWRYEWCVNQRLDGVSPYAGVKAYEVPEDAQ